MIEGPAYNPLVWLQIDFIRQSCIRIIQETKEPFLDAKDSFDLDRIVLQPFATTQSKWWLVVDRHCWCVHAVVCVQKLPA